MNLLDIFGGLGEGVAAGLQAHDSIKQRQRQQDIEDEEREERQRLLTLERALTALDLQDRAFPDEPVQRYNVQDGQVAPVGGYTDRDEARRAAEEQRARTRRTDLADRNRQITTAERVAEASARGRAQGTPEGEGRVPPRPTEVQSRLALGLARAEPALDTIERLIRSFDGRVPVRSLAGRMGIAGQFATPADEQAYNQAAESIATAILRAESGAAISADEARSYARQFLPAPGDRPEVIQQKLAAVRATLQSMRQIVGGGSLDTPAPSDTPLSDDEIWERIMRGGPAR